MRTIAITAFFCMSLCVTSAQTISTFAGGGSGSGSGDGGAATSGILTDPVGGTFDKHGNYYFVDALGGNRVRKVDTNQIITTVAGTGIAGFSGDGGAATNAKLRTPTAVKLDSAGNLYIVDQGNFRIRKVNAVSNAISTIAGTGVSVSTGDGSAASASSLGSPQDIAIDNSGNIYVAEWNARVRKINSSGIISSICGTGVPGYSGDGGRADTSRIGGLTGICIDKVGNIYLADQSNSRIFKINVSGIISTFAGTSTGYLFNADNNPATNANIDPVKIGIDKFECIYISENQNYRVRRVDKHGIIHTVAGIGTAGFSGDGAPATAAQFRYPSGIAFDSCNNFYVPEANNNRVRKITYPHCNYLDVPQTVSNKDLQVFPNPTNDVVNINGLREPANYRLLDIVGRITMQGCLHKADNEVSLSFVSPGTYFLEITIQNERVMKRIVKE